MMRDSRKARMRKELVEHPFAIIKHWMNHGYFLMRGMNKVATEVSLSVLVYNMKRVLNILGVSTLIAALRAMAAKGLSFLFPLAQRRIYFVIRILSQGSSSSVA
jgi:hypothetical protein